MNGNYPGHMLRIVMPALEMNPNWLKSIDRTGNNA